MTSGKTSHEAPDLAAWRAVLPELLVLPAGEPHHLEAHVKHGDDVVVSLTQIRSPNVTAQPMSETAQRKLSQLDIWHDPQDIDGELRGRATFELPADLVGGYYRAELISNSYNATSLVLLTPQKSDKNEAEVRGWGLSLDLPTTRSRRSWGVGDLADVAELGVLAANWGAEFLYMRPQTLRELRFEGESLAPETFLPPAVRARYLPASVLRVEDVPELAYVPAPDRALIEWDAEEFTPLNESPEDLDIGLVFQSKSAALDLISAIELTPARQLEYEQFVADQGEALANFALWAAIAENCHRTGQPWPEDAAEPESFGARRAGDELGAEIEKQRRLQWRVQQQLEQAHARSRSAGMRIGLLRAALWQPDAEHLESNGAWLRALGASLGGLLVTPQRNSEVSPAALAVLAIEAERSKIELVLSIAEDSPWRKIAQEMGVCVRVQPWDVAADPPVINSDSFAENQFLEPRIPLDVPLANYLSEEYLEALPETLGERAREDFRRTAQNVRLLLERELRAAQLIDDSASQRAVIEALHVWGVQSPPRLTVLRLRDLLGQRHWSGVKTGWKNPLADAFGAVAVIDDLPEAPTLLSLLRRFENMGV